MVILFLSLYLTQELGWSKIEAGYVFFAFGLGSLVGAWLGGFLSDKVGNYPVMLTSLFLAGVAYIGMAHIFDLHTMIIWAFLTSVSTDIFRAPLYSMTANYTKPENTTRAISLLRLTFNLGVAIGPMIGGFLAAMYGYYWIFLLDGVTCILAGLFMVLYLKAEPTKITQPSVDEPQAHARSPYFDYKFIAFLFFAMLNMIAFFQIIATVPLFLKEVHLYGEEAVGWFFTANGLLIFILEMPIILKLEENKVVLKAIIYGTVMIAISHFAMNFTTLGILSIAIYTFFVSVGEIISMPFYTSIAVKRSNKTTQGTYIAMCSLMFSLAYIIGPYSGLWLVEHYSWNIMWSIMAGISLVAVGGHLLTNKYIASSV